MKLHRQSHTTWTDTKAKTAGGSPLVVGTTKTRAEGEIPAWGQHPAMPTDVSFQEGHGPGEIRLGGLQLSRSGELGLHDKADLSVDRRYRGMNGETESLGAHVTSHKLRVQQLISGPAPPMFAEVTSDKRSRGDSWLSPPPSNTAENMDPHQISGPPAETLSGQSAPTDTALHRQRPRASIRSGKDRATWEELWQCWGLAITAGKEGSLTPTPHPAICDYFLIYCNGMDN